jgi:hypothetical protein
MTDVYADLFDADLDDDLAGSCERSAGDALRTASGA